MEFTQYDLDTINLLVVSYFKNGEAKTPDDVSRVLALVMKSRTQTKDPTDTFLEELKKIKDAAENQKKFEPKVPWPEKPYSYVVPNYRYWGLNEPIPRGQGSTVGPIPGNLDRDFPRTA